MALRLGIGAVVVAACAAALWLRPIGSTQAQPGTIKVKLAQGTLRVSAPSVSATSAAAKSVTVTVVDARGTGVGWSLRVVASRPVAVSKISARCAKHSTCTLPRASGIGSSPRILQTQTGSGMGVIKLTVTLARLSSGPSVPVTFAVS